MENKTKKNNDRFKEVLAQYIQKVQEEFDLKKKRGSVFTTHTIYGNKYLSEKNYINLKGLYLFAKRNKLWPSERIEEFIKANANTFKFLNRFVEIVPNAVSELRIYGYDRLATLYIQQLKAEKVVEGVRRTSSK